jgi:uncharacterized protein (TIRG00374 family)
MDQTVMISEERGLRRGILTVLMWVFAAGALYWLLRGLEWKEFVSDLVFIDWKWVVPAVVLDVLSYVVQAARWNYVLEPLGAPPLLRSTQAIYVGLFTNEILPLRSGEFLRAFLLSKWQDLAYSVALSSVAIERLLDGIWLAIAFGVTALFVPLPPVVKRGAQILGLFILLATGLLIAVLAFGLRVTHALERTRAGGRGLLATLLHWIDRLFEGLQAIGHSASLYRAVAASFVLLLTQILALWAMMEAYGLSYSFWVASGVLFILHLGTAIPNAPANIGSAQLSAVAGLVLFGVNRTTATEFALVMFVILTVPLLLGGVVAVMCSGLSIGDIRRHVRRNRRR